MPPQTILITGAGGFVGRYLTGLWAGSKDNIVSLNLDLRETEALSRFILKTAPDQVYHLAAQPFVPLAIENPWETYDINVGGTLTLLESLHRTKKNCKFLYVSSADVYGLQSQKDLPFSESLFPQPLNPYSGSKLAAESFCRQYNNFSPYIETVIARPFNHIGVGQRKEFVVPNFCQQIKTAVLSGKKEVHVGDLSPTRDFTNVKDIVAAYQILMLKGAPGEIYNICSGIEISIEKLIQTLIKISGKELICVTDPERVRTSETSRLIGNNAKMKALGWEPKYSLEETLLEIYSSIS